MRRVAIILLVIGPLLILSGAIERVAVGAKGTGIALAASGSVVLVVGQVTERGTREDDL
jgi:hypothetical protein